MFSASALQSHLRTHPDLVGKVAATHRNLAGQPARMRQLSALIKKLAETRWPLLIVGESGTGKEVVARAIHDVGRMGEFVVIDCALLVGPLAESELFGDVEGVFVAGSTPKVGLIERANGGTAFFDRVEALPLKLQAKLLRWLQKKRTRPIGATRDKRSDFHVIATTTRDLAEDVEAGVFRRDLFYRLNVCNIRLAPLRERKEDIPALVSHFLARMGGNFTITTQAMAVLLLYDWPANVRELEGCIHHMATVRTGEVIDTRDFPPHLQNFLSGIKGTFLSNFPSQAGNSRTRVLNSGVRWKTKLSTRVQWLPTGNFETRPAMMSLQSTLTPFVSISAIADQSTSSFVPIVLDQRSKP